LNLRAESTGGKGLKIPCQNTFKDKPAFIKRLMKVLVARNMIGSYIAAVAKTTDSSESHNMQSKVPRMNLLQRMI